MVKDLYSDIKHGIKNIILWFRVIWCDRQWDHHFFNVILRRKLSLMRDHFSEHDMSGRDAEILGICVKLLDRIIANQYSESSKKRGEEIMRQDSELLYKIIRENVRSWWD